MQFLKSFCHQHQFYFPYINDTDKQRDKENHQLGNIVLMYRKILKHYRKYLNNATIINKEK